MKEKYIVVDEYSLDDLQRKVNEMINNGYRPIGTVTIIEHHIQDIYGDPAVSREYLQPMIKE